MYRYDFCPNSLLEGSGAEASLPACLSNRRKLALIGARSFEKQPYGIFCGIDWKSSSLPSGLGEGSSICQRKRQAPRSLAEVIRGHKSNNPVGLCQWLLDGTLPFVGDGRAKRRSQQSGSISICQTSADVNG